MAAAGELRAQPDATPGMAEMSLPPKPSVLERSLRFQKVNRDDGLPQNSVFTIAQDRTGFIWLGTQQGLVRYDGQRSRVFRHQPDDPKSLAASWVTKVLVGKDGTLWVGTHGGVHRYNADTSTFERFVASDSPNALKSGIVLSLAESPDGRIWIGTAGGGVSVLDPSTGNIKTFTAAQSLAVPAVLAEKNGEVWVGTQSGVQRLDTAKGIFQPVLPDIAEQTINALYRDRAGNLWVGTANDGLRVYPPGKPAIVYRASDEPGKDERKLADNIVKAIIEDRDGRIWVGTEQALHLHEGAAGGGFRAHHYVAEDSRSIKPPIEALFQDNAGAVWVGTVGDGAAILDPLALRFHFYRGHTFVLAEHGDELWTASAETEETCRWRGKTTLEGACYKTGSWAIRVFIDSKKTAWVSTLAGGLLRLDANAGDRWIYYTNDPKDPRSIMPGVSAVTEDRKGRIWVSTFGGGVQYLEGRGHRFTTPIQSPSQEIYAILEDPKRDGLFWLTTAGDGLLAFDSLDGKVTPYKPRPDEPENKTDNAVVGILFDGEQHIWLATFGGGLKRLDRTSGKFKSYRVADGLPSDSVYSVLRDGKGMVWASTVAGLARFDPKSERFAVFTEDDGLQGDEFGMLSGLAARDGRLFFGGLNGFTVFKPDEIEVDRNAPAVQVTGIRVVGKRYSDTRPEAIREISVAYNETQLAFDLATLAFSGSARTTFEYQLEGLSDRWIKLESPSLSLTGLDDGDYTLLLRSRNRHGAESKPTAIALSIAPPFWRTWWAYGIYGFTFLAILFAVYRYQQARIDRLEKMGRLAAVEQQFEMTATVQKWFLPPSPRYTSGSLDLMGFYRAADKCSGDWWWYERIDSDRLWIIVADVTGHGVAPAMLTAAVAMGLGVQSDQGMGSDDDIVGRLAKINKEVLSRCKGHQYMTMTSVLIDESTGAMNVYTLGGLPAVLLDRGGRHRVIGARGIPLGSAENLEVGQQAATIQMGERLLIATDGIIEANLPSGRQFGFRRFVQLSHAVRELPVDQAVTQMVSEIDKARGTARQDDDFTMCLFERRPNGLRS